MIYFDEKKLAYGNEFPNYVCKIPDEIWEEHNKYESGISWDIIGGIFTDLRKSKKYKSFIRLKEIDKELRQNEKEFAGALEEPVLYLHNKYYKIKYSFENYADLIQSGEIFPSKFPMMIYDCTHLSQNAEEMSLEELTELYLFLSEKREKCFRIYSDKKSALINEKEELNEE